jgi:hypothetical protein
MRRGNLSALRYIIGRNALIHPWAGGQRLNRLQGVGRTPNMVLAQNVLRDFSGVLKLAKPYGREH